MGNRTSIIIAAAIALAFLPSFAHADEKLAAEFLRKNPGILKDFDPVADELKADGLEGDELKQQATKLRAAMGEHGKLAGVVRHVPQGRRARFAAPPTEKRLQRLARAARRNAMYAQMEATDWSTLTNWTIQNNGEFARFVPHY